MTVVAPDFAWIFKQLARNRPRVVIGLDGFLDEFATVVAQRTSSDQFSSIPSIAAFGCAISEAAGRNFGRELVIRSIEGGGNGPNFANALAALGASVDAFGTLGIPPHPKFTDFLRGCRSVTSISESFGRTIAMEFSDGKLMFNISADLARFDAAVMDAAIDTTEFAVSCREAALIGLVNWSCYPHMTAIWQRIQERVLASLSHRPFVFVDLADPSTRGPGALRALAPVLQAMQRTCRLVLGMNLNEASRVCEAFAVSVPFDADAVAVRASAERLRSILAIEQVVIHTRGFSVAAWPGGTVDVATMICDAPLRTTGVGDRFNAGYAAGLLVSDDHSVVMNDRAMAEAGLRLGNAVAGAFVRRGRSPTVDEVLAAAAATP